MFIPIPSLENGHRCVSGQGGIVVFCAFLTSLDFCLTWPVLWKRALIISGCLLGEVYIPCNHRRFNWEGREPCLFNMYLRGGNRCLLSIYIGSSPIPSRHRFPPLPQFRRQCLQPINRMPGGIFEGDSIVSVSLSLLTFVWFQWFERNYFPLFVLP